jgi:hypothetical protein
MIDYTISDLQDRLEEIENLSKGLPSQEGSLFVQIAQNERIQDEKEATEQCLHVSKQILVYVDKIPPRTIHVILATRHTNERVVCTPEEYSAIKETYQEDLTKLNGINVMEGNLISAKDVIAKLEAGQKLLQNMESALKKSNLILSRLAETYAGEN